MTGTEKTTYQDLTSPSETGVNALLEGTKAAPASNNQNLTIVFPAPGDDGITFATGTKVLDSAGNEVMVSRIELIGEPNKPWRANFSTLPGFSGSVTAQAQGIPAIGQYWEGQGGYYAGVMRDGNHQWHLILSPSVEDAPWGNYDETIPGEFSRRDGQHNTALILAAEPNNKIASLTREINIDGHSDFYWPAQCENNLLFTNLPEHLSPEWHWSSTQHSARYAWGQYFEDGGQYIRRKNNSLAARAVRRLPIE